MGADGAAPHELLLVGDGPEREHLSVSGLAATSQYRRVGASSGLVCEMSWPTDTETGDAG